MSIEIDSTNTKVGNIDNFINLSNFLYNRHTHDKTMFVNVSEIDFVTSVESIINSSDDKDKFFELVKLNYSSLFGTSVNEEIKSLTKKDLIEICDYNYIDDSFNGLEYYIIRHLKDSHIDKCIEDLRAKRLDKLIKLSVSKGNLIVKVFPSKVLEVENQVSYCVSLLYFVLIHIYKHLHKECSICEIVKALFIKVNPIVIKVAYTVLINCDNSYSWLKQLQQLSSMYKFFSISSTKEQVKFLFRPKRHYLTSTVNVPVINEIPSDTNNEKRFISCTYKLRKQDVLECKTTIISKDMVDCVFATQIDDNVGSMYSALSDVEHIYLSNYNILDTLLSFTKQHEELRNRLSVNGMEFTNTNNSMPVSFRQNVIVNYIRRNLYQQAFGDIKATHDEELLALVINKLKKVGQKNSLVDYSILIMELLYKEKEFVEEILANLDERTSNKIRKVLKNLKKSKRVENLFCLNEFYRGC
ncbi:MAG: hypothetical protein OSJ27_04435 [Candidatus Gastranaerophilales bacterium]|nr:hypothetical protein [Candidatus Gastranaerophilales bacterium]